MLGHIGINVPDLAIARQYYGDLLPQVDFELFADDDDQFAFMPAKGKRGTFLFFYPTRSQRPYSRHSTTGLQHLAFMAQSHSAVDDLHRWALSVGSEVIHEPREFPEYPPPYYAGWGEPEQKGVELLRSLVDVRGRGPPGRADAGHRCGRDPRRRRARGRHRLVPEMGRLQVHRNPT